MNEDFLQKKLQERRDQDAYRSLKLPSGKTDFCSNDYLGIATEGRIEKALSNPDPTRNSEPARAPEHVRKTLPDSTQDRQAGTASPPKHGSTGSRLLAGNYALIEEVEKEIAAFHQAQTGLIYNSGFDANLGLMSSVPQRNDTILYDWLSHASIRDGVRLSFAKSFSFAHNDMADLEKKLQSSTGNIFVVTESVFSMDGDQAPLEQISALCIRYGAHLIVDEAHATGVIGKRGEGLVQQMGLVANCFARVHTFGKAAGCHGAIILGSDVLRDYLVNFSRAFIYTTALPETSIQAIRSAYRLFPELDDHRGHLRQLIAEFREETKQLERTDSTTPIQAVIIPGNEAVKEVAQRCQDQGLDTRPILYPTVPKGSERLRIVLHSFNTSRELSRLIPLLKP